MEAERTLRESLSDSVCSKPRKILKTCVSSDVYTETLKNTDNKEEDEEEDSLTQSWDGLPHVVLLSTLARLSEKDRLTSQLVCKRWYDIINFTSSLWTEKNFQFSGRNPTDLTQAPYRYATNFTKKFGRFFKILTFRLYSPISSNVCRKFQKCVKACLNNLTRRRCHLVELHIPVLQLDRGHWHQSQEDMCTQLSKFFCSAKTSLARINLRGARSYFSEGYKVLFAIGFNLGETLSYLDIEDFFSSKVPVNQLPEFNDSFRNFKNLTELSLNYSYISEDFIETLVDAANPDVMKFLKIKISPMEQRDQRISNDVWKSLSDHSPGLGVAMYFERVMTFSEHFNILTPSLPLSEVEFDGSYYADLDWQIVPTINNILPQYKNRLTSLTIDICDTQERIERPLLSLLAICPNLEYLKVNGYVCTKLLSDILMLKGENRIKIKSLYLRVLAQDYDTTNEDRELEAISHKYKDVIANFEEFQAMCCVSI